MNFGVSHFVNFLATAVAWSLFQSCACESSALFAGLSLAFLLDVDAVEVLAALWYFQRSVYVCGTVDFEISNGKLGLCLRRRCKLS